MPAGQSISLSWPITVPDGYGSDHVQSGRIDRKVVGWGRGDDPGVVAADPRLRNRLPLPIRGKQSKRFEFAKLLASAESDSLQHQSLTLQMVSNPSWYAVMALPYLMEYPHQCSEQTFNRLYANSLARHIIDSDPKIDRVFAQWRGTTALDSPLEKESRSENIDAGGDAVVSGCPGRESGADGMWRFLFDNNRSCR